MRIAHLVTLLFVIPAAISMAPAAEDVVVKTEATPISLTPIGHIKLVDGRTTIVLDKRYESGLLGLEQFSHVQVIWWFSKNDTPRQRSILQVHPRGNRDNPLTGVFATRAPVRPNLIALTLSKIISVKENIIEIDKTDAFDGTPVLDIKPFVPGYDSVSDATGPKWLAK